MTAPPNELDELISKLGFIELYAIFMRPTDKWKSPYGDEGRPMMVKHLHYLLDLQERSILVGAGPLDLDGDTIEGMCIVRAASREEAEAIAAEEPFGAVGWRVNTVRTWHLNEGVMIAPIHALNSTT